MPPTLRYLCSAREVINARIFSHLTEKVKLLNLATTNLLLVLVSQKGKLDLLVLSSTMHQMFDQVVLSSTLRQMLDLVVPLSTMPVVHLVKSVGKPAIMHSIASIEWTTLTRADILQPSYMRWLLKSTMDLKNNHGLLTVEQILTSLMI